MNITSGLIVFWLICGAIAAAIGSAKNRSALGWFLLGALFAPSVLIVAMLPKLPPRPPLGEESSRPNSFVGRWVIPGQDSGLDPLPQAGALGVIHPFRVSGRVAIWVDA